MSALAILGGAPVRKEPGAYLKWPLSGEDEREAVKKVLLSGCWGCLGPESKAFAAEYAAYLGTKYCLAVINGTSALEIALRGLEIGYGDEVIVPSYTFSATIHAVLNTGAWPVFADIGDEDYALSAASAEAAITPKTKAILPVHVGGRMADMDALAALAKRRGLYLLEDAAQAHGSKWRDRFAGSIGDAATFSFQASKNLSCGEGGAIVTSDDKLYERLWSLHHNGRSFGELGYDHPVLGTDARLAEWQSALLRVKLKKLDAEIDRRQANAARIKAGLKAFPFLKPLPEDSRITRDSLHLLLLRYDCEALSGLSRGAFIRALNAENVCLASEGYSESVLDMAFLTENAYERQTGRRYARPELPNADRAARAEGCWLYQSSLLGSAEDADAILEALDRIQKQAGALKKEEGRI